MSIFNDIEMSSVQPLIMYCHKIIPLVYDNSLSYYEVLCKVVAKLNEFINEYGSLGEAFKQIDNKFSEVDAAIAELNNMLNDQKLSLEDIKEQIATNNTLISALQQLTNSLSSEIAALKASVTAINNNLVTINNELKPHIDYITIVPKQQQAAAGAELYLTAVVDGHGNFDRSVTWSSDNDKIIINDNGTVSIAEDAEEITATITATSIYDTTKKGLATISVGAIASEILSITITPQSASGTVGDTIQFYANVQGTGHATTDVTWSSSNASVTINSAGLATINDDNNNTAVITATSEYDNTKSATSIININAVPAINSITITPNNITLEAGSTQQFTVTVDAVGGADSSVTWSVNSQQVAISQDGLLTVPDGAEGSFIVIATSNFDNSKIAVANVNITAQSRVISITLEPSSLILQKGEGATITANVDGTGVFDNGVTWSHPDGSISFINITDTQVTFTVAQGGNIPSTTIVATSKQDPTITATCQLTIVEPPQVVSVSVSPANATVNVGATKQYSANVQTISEASEDVSWSVTPAANATISSTGLLTAKAAGSVTVKATSTFDTTKYGVVNATLVNPIILNVIGFRSGTNTITTINKQITKVHITYNSNDIVLTFSDGTQQRYTRSTPFYDGNSVIFTVGNKTSGNYVASLSSSEYFELSSSLDNRIVIVKSADDVDWSIERSVTLTINQFGTIQSIIIEYDPD